MQAETLATCGCLFFQAEDGIRDADVTGVQTCALPIWVAVRTLCDFTAREGDLDHRFTPAPSAEEGIAGHAEIAQIGRASCRERGHLSEVAVSHTRRR